MKRFFAIALCALMLLPTLTSCSPPPEVDEVRDEIAALIEASHEINDIFYGEGLPVDTSLSSGYEKFHCVSASSPYRSLAEIKVAAEKVYSAEYMSAIYDMMFSGHYDSVSGSVQQARYWETNGKLLQLKECDVLLTGEHRTYDYSTMKIVKPSRADYIKFEIMSEKNGEQMLVKLSAVLTENGWRLDSPTY